MPSQGSVMVSLVNFPAAQELSQKPGHEGKQPAQQKARELDGRAGVHV